MAIHTGLPSIVPINFKGNWNRSVTYFTNDVVEKDNANYIALGPNVGIEPPSPATWGQASTDIFGLVLGGTIDLTSPITFGSAVPVSSTQALVEIGPGPWDGVSSGHFTGSSNGTALGINLASGSTADPLNIQIAGTTSFKISMANPLATLISPAPTTVPLVVKSAAGQTADIQQWQDSAGNVLGRFVNGSRGPMITSDGIQANVWGLQIVDANNNEVIRLTNNGKINTIAPFTSLGGATGVPIVAQGSPSQSANLQEWQDSTGYVWAKVDATGRIFTTSDIGCAAISNVSDNGPYIGFGTAAITANAHGENNIPFICQGSPSQVGDLQQWQSSTGSVLAKVDAAGDGTFNSRVYIGHTASTLQNVGQTLNCWNNSSSAVPFVVAANNGQTADIQQWQSGTAAVLARVDSSGAIAPQNGARLTSGVGVPTTPGGINPTAGDVYHRIDGGTGTHIYFCSVGGATPTWVALV